MKVILLRIGEIFLKGENRAYFENRLLTNIREKLQDFVCDIRKIQSRILIENFSENDLYFIEQKLQTIFGLQSYSVATKVENDLEKIKIEAAKQVKKGTFKVETNRADKRFPLPSYKVSAEVGAYILNICTDVQVNVTNPEQIVNIDIRENGHSYIFTYVQNCERGMPYKTGGRAVSLLSGGIDSPVSSYLMAKRGMEIVFLHFHSHPYTSDMAKQKVLTLAKKVASFCGKMKIYFVSATQFQETTEKFCEGSYQITLLRRFMMRIANIICEREKALAIITGESLAQVASQTVEGIFSSNQVAEYPILRPLIGMDKQDIIKIANHIDTYSTSILPYEDCCTIFLPKNPVIKPKIANILKEESKIDIASLVDEAISKMQIEII